jgi:hypothetical protein
MALPVALFASITAFALGSVAILSSIDAQEGTKHDRGSKSAIAAADAGASVALLRLNRFQSKITSATPCVGPAGEALTESSPGWCPPTAVESLNSEASFTYQISAYNPAGTLSVVSVGTAGGVSRRVKVGLFSLAGNNPFGEEGLIGEENIDIEGNADIRTNLGTNGDVKRKGSSATICGNVRHGIGKTAPEPDCDGTIYEGERELPPVTLPAGIETLNSDCRLVPNCTGPDPAGEVDTYTKPRTSSKPWDAGLGTINVQGATLSMGGKDYLVRGLYINNGTLIMLANAHIRIYVDTPEKCGFKAGATATQVQITGNANIESTAFTEGTDSSVPAIYVLGSPDPMYPTAIDLSGNSGTNELLLYAPFSEVNIGGNATWIGMIAGKSLRIHGGPKIETDQDIEPPELAASSLWARTRYVECTGATGSPPDASC